MKKLPRRISRRHPQETTREATLRILKLRHELTVSELCTALKVTHTAVRRCLSHLQQEGLVAFTTHQHGTGRPIHKYRLTEKAAIFFPSGYESLLAQILDTIFEASGHKAVMDFLKTNNDRLINALMPRFLNKDLKERVEELTKYFVENGYMSDWITLADGNFFLFHQNCAIYNMASRYRQFCILEPRLMESLLAVKLTRQQYILKNQPVCGYLIDAHRPL